MLHPLLSVGKEDSPPVFYNEAIARYRAVSEKRPGSRWAVYQNHALDHSCLGNFACLLCGPGCTFGEPPEQLPDSSQMVGWPYLHVGWVDPQTGRLVRT